LEINGQLILVENVPARVNEETGEQFFAPETVERLQAMILGDSKPRGKFCSNKPTLPRAGLQ
jgi:hypothetical protein